MCESVRPILVTGGTGQLASALVDAADMPIRRVGRPDFDFDRPASIATCFHAIRPWLVVNAAAHTGVDAAETDRDAAFRANRDGPAELALVCAEAAVPLIHVSTDYVYDGGKTTPYAETDGTVPQGVYGASKLAGEEVVLAAGGRAIILRTAWVYSATGRNFLLTMLNLGKTREQLSVVADQRGCPTAARDLAEAILGIARLIRDQGWRDEYQGVFHAAGNGEATWHEFAAKIFAVATRHGARAPTINPIPTSAYPTPARRPANSRLDCAKLRRVFGITLPDWQDSVARTVDQVMRRSA